MKRKKAYDPSIKEEVQVDSFLSIYFWEINSSLHIKILAGLFCK